jgi:hypothetical protein
MSEHNCINMFNGICGIDRDFIVAKAVARLAYRTGECQ